MAVLFLSVNAIICELFYQNGTMLDWSFIYNVKTISQIFI